MSQEPVREIFKAHCGVQHIRDLFPQGFLAVSNFVCVGCCPAAVRAAFSRSSFNWPRLRTQYSASLTRSFEPLSRSIWYSPAPSHNSMTSTRRCRMVWAVLECFMPSSSHGASAYRVCVPLPGSDAANHDVDVDISRMVMPIRVSADDGRMTGEVFFAEFQAKCLCLFHGQPVVGCISWVKADDILVAFDITMLGVLAILAVCQQTGCCKREIATLKGVEQVRIPPLRLALFIRSCFPVNASCW